MSEERITKLEEAMGKLLEAGGANIQLQDPRVSQVQNWLIGIVGAGIIVTLGWLATSVDSLNRNFAALSQWKEYVDHRLDALERPHDPR
jgi:hypothetical protein